MRHNKHARRSQRHKSEKSFLPPDEFIVEGGSAIAEYLRFRPGSVLKVYGKREEISKLEPSIKDNNVDCFEVSEWDEERAGFMVKAPVFAIVRIVALSESDLLAQLKKTPAELVVVLDHITDPRNLGAIARSCAFFGVKQIVVPKKRQVLLTGASVNTAQGAFALVDLCLVTNLSRAVEKLKENGYWVVGADMGGEPIREVAGFYEKTALLFGSEGNGVSDLMRKKCDRMVSIEGAGVSLESLNVSVAAGVMLHSFFSAKSNSNS